MNKQKGFTLPELLFVIAFLCVGAIGIGLLVVAYHFISKFW